MFRLLGMRNVVGCVLIVPILAFPASAQEADPSFKGRPFYVYIGPGQPGGSYDLYARLLARHIGRHLPGEPTVIAQSRSGAAGMVLANYLYNVAPRDGTAIGILAEAAALSEVLGTTGVRYEVNKFNWIGRLATTVNITLTWHTSKIQTAADAMRTEAPFASTQPGAAAYDQPTVLNKVVGTKFKVIPGYRGSVPMLLAMERGETDGAFTDWSTFKVGHPHWINEAKIRVIVQYTVERQPDLPKIPTAVELGRTASDRELLQLFMSSADLGRASVAPPGIPPRQLKAVRDAFDATLKDPKFFADVKQSKLEISPLSGEALQEVIRKVTQVSPAVLARAQTMMKN